MLVGRSLSPVIRQEVDRAKLVVGSWLAALLLAGGAILATMRQRSGRLPLPAG